MSFLIQKKQKNKYFKNTGFYAHRRFDTQLLCEVSGFFKKVIKIQILKLKLSHYLLIYKINL